MSECRSGGRSHHRDLKLATSTSKPFDISAPFPDVRDRMEPVDHLSVSRCWSLDAGQVARGLNCEQSAKIFSRYRDRDDPRGAAYPMLSLGYVVVAAVSVMWLGESMAPAKVLGIALICAGVILVSRSSV